MPARPFASYFDPDGADKARANRIDEDLEARDRVAARRHKTEHVTSPDPDNCWRCQLGE